MRPGQNKRMRGRSNNNNNNNNRRGPNPLTRSYESNGPDVKIRGTAQHVAEKYLQLARDAQSSGDPVMAESYLQHAEHYFRIIAAAQQAQQQQMGFNRQQNDNQPNGDDSVEDEDVHDRFASPAERAQAILNQPQPNVGQQANPFGTQRDTPAEDSGQPERNERPDRSERHDRNQDRNDRQGGRGNRRQRNFDNADSRTDGRPEGRNRPVRPDSENPERPAQNADAERPAPQPRNPGPANDADDDQPMLPSFITRANRNPEPAADTGASDAPDAAGETPRPRRRRRPLPKPDQAGNDTDAARSKPDEIAAGE